MSNVNIYDISTPNKYFGLYLKIVEKFTRSPALRHERHHIVPKSLGGSNARENLVKLSPRAHFICHRLLPKFLKSKVDCDKMVIAAFMIRHCRDLPINSKSYEKLRLEFTEIQKTRAIARKSHTVMLTPENIEKSKVAKKLKFDTDIEYQNRVRNAPKLLSKTSKWKEAHQKAINKREEEFVWRYQQLEKARSNKIIVKFKTGEEFVFLQVKFAAEYFGVSRITIQNWVKSNKNKELESIGYYEKRISDR